MSDVGSDSGATGAMADEFDRMPAWTAEAVGGLGPTHALPAACRGSGGPAALDWLLEGLRVRSGIAVLDVGAGMGGPAEYAARTSGCAPILLDPMAAACRTASRLFGHPTIVGDGSALPLADDSFAVAWSLGVLCTVDDKARHLGEIVRVLRPQGSLGLLVYERTVDTLPEQPDGNLFPSGAEIDHLLHACGLVVTASTQLRDFPPDPADWTWSRDRVDAWISTRHGHEAAWQRAQQQESILTALIADRLVVGRVLVTRVGGH